MSKPIFIHTHYLGAVKQMPFLIRELRNVIPSASIDVNVSDYNGDHDISAVLKRDLKKEKVMGCNFVDHVKASRRREEYAAFIDFEVRKHVPDNYFGDISFHIDPLKFEKRKLLNDDEIRELRGKYGIAPDAQVVLGGSLHNVERDCFLDATEALIKKRPGSRILVVPREGLGRIPYELSERGASFETDVSSLRDSTADYLVVTERGVLDDLYSICDIAILGDTLGSGSGQNPLEPAFYGKRMISGKGSGDKDYPLNNGIAYDGLKKSGLLTMVEEEDLTAELLRDVSDSELSKSRAKAAEFIKSRQGAARVYAEIVKDKIEKGDEFNESEAMKKLAPFSAEVTTQKTQSHHQ